MKDHYDYALTGATGAAHDAFEQALAAFRSWRSGTETHLARSLAEAPDFTMAQVLAAYLSVCSRDVARVRAARAAHARLSRLPANERERLHIVAIGKALDDDFAGFTRALDELLRRYPRDVIALQVAHAFDYLTGDMARLAARPQEVLPAWSKALPGYHAVLAMQAFGLVEMERYQAATDIALQALQLDAFDARAHHTMAHVYEMTDDPAGGARWMQARLAFWAENTVVATHCWWHWALFHLAQGEIDAALALYDQRIRAGRSLEVGDLIDASALLWRFALMGVDSGSRWHELSHAWAPRITDAYCTFNDLHAMLAFVGAREWDHARRLESELTRRQHGEARYAQTTRLIGLPACRAFTAFGRGHYARATALLGALPEFAHRIGGSHAQRDVLYLTLLEAVQRMRRPAWRRAA